MSVNGASIDDLNIVRKQIEILKGGGLAQEARPAQVLYNKYHNLKSFKKVSLRLVVKVITMC